MDYLFLRNQVFEACTKCYTQFDYYCPEDIYTIFKNYYELYYAIFGREHICLKTDTICKVIMNFLDAHYEYGVELLPDEMELLSRLFFKSNIKNCDYSILIFSNPRIIKFRLYESAIHEAGEDGLSDHSLMIARTKKV